METFTRELKISDTGKDVLALQERLLQIGFKNVFVNNKIKTLEADNIFGEITKTALASFQAKVIDLATQLYISNNIKGNYHVEPDGIMNFETWWILYNYFKLSEFYKTDIGDVDIKDIRNELVKTFLEISLAEEGVKETYPYNNSGKRVNEYIYIGSGKKYKSGIAWCYAFINWCIVQAVNKLKLEYLWNYEVYTPNCRLFCDKNKIGIKNPRFNQIESGDLFLIYGSNRGDAIHIGGAVVAKSGNNNVITIEGNTNDNGSSEGLGVFKRIRPSSQLWYICKWNRLWDNEI